MTTPAENPKHFSAIEVSDFPSLEGVFDIHVHIPPGTVIPVVHPRRRFPSLRDLIQTKLCGL